MDTSPLLPLSTKSSRPNQHLSLSLTKFLPASSTPHNHPTHPTTTPLLSLLASQLTTNAAATKHYTTQPLPCSTPQSPTHLPGMPTHTLIHPHAPLPPSHNRFLHHQLHTFACTHILYNDYTCPLQLNTHTLYSPT